MLRYCFFSWWERMGSAQANGVPKLMMKTATEFSPT